MSSATFLWLLQQWCSLMTTIFGMLKIFVSTKYAGNDSLLNGKEQGILYKHVSVQFSMVRACAKRMQDGILPRQIIACLPQVIKSILGCNTSNRTPFEIMHLNFFLKGSYCLNHAFFK